MPAAGGLKKAELYLESPVKRGPVVRGNPVLPLFQPVHQLLQISSYVLLWKQPALSAYVFIWLNLSILCHVALGLTTLLSITLTLLLLTTNVVMLEHTLTQTNMLCTLLCGLCGIDNSQSLPGAEELSIVLVNCINSVCNVLLNIRDSSQHGATQFWFSLCSTVAMLTIILTYLASTTTLLILFWFLFCYPAIRYHELYRKLTREQIVNTLNMSVCMIYNMYLAIVGALSATEIPPEQGQVEFENSIRDEYEREMSEPASSLRHTTMSYIRGLPSVMTLNWNRFSSWRRPPATPSTEEDSDYGIDDIEDDHAAPKTRSQTVDTLGSDADLQFPSIDRKDTLDDGTATLAADLDPKLLYDDDNSEFTMSELGGFTIGRGEEMSLLDAVNESDNEADGPPFDEPSPSPEFGSSIVSSPRASRDGTLDGKQFMVAVPMCPQPPADPKPQDLSSFRQQRFRSEPCASEEAEFYVVSDEDIVAADEDISSHSLSPRHDHVTHNNPRV